MYKHPSVEQAVVIGYPDDIDGDHAMAVVILKPEYLGKIFEDDLTRFVNEQVTEKYRLVGGTKIVKRFPLTSTGKPRKRDILEAIIKNDMSELM